MTDSQRTIAYVPDVDHEGSLLFCANLVNTFTDGNLELAKKDAQHFVENAHGSFILLKNSEENKNEARYKL